MLLLTLEAVMPGRICVVGRVGIQNVTPPAEVSNHDEPHLYECTLFYGNGDRRNSAHVYHNRAEGAWKLVRKACAVLDVENAGYNAP